MEEQISSGSNEKETVESIRCGLNSARDAINMMYLIIRMLEGAGEDHNNVRFCENRMIRSGLDEAIRVVRDGCIDNLAIAVEEMEGGAA